MPERQYPPDFVLLLASRSPRRQELLRAVGIPHVVISSHGEELDGGLPPETLAEQNAVSKVRGAEVSPGTLAGAFLLGADTIVVTGDTVLGKPASRDEAAAMLKLLAGGCHKVVSGVCLARWDGAAAGRLLTGSAITTVEFGALDDAQIESYLESGEWHGKAGAYAIQGRAALFAAGLRGEYSNVVGLPLELVTRLFSAHGFDVLRRSWKRHAGETTG